MVSRDPADEAARILRLVWKPLSPTRQVPVDPARICETLGVAVPEPDSGTDATCDVDRRRLACAHDLGLCVVEDEDFADAFAANLLMPEDEVRTRARVGSTAMALALTFSVSHETMAARLIELGLG